MKLIRCSVMVVALFLAHGGETTNATHTLRRLMQSYQIPLENKTPYKLKITLIYGKEGQVSGSSELEMIQTSKSYSPELLMDSYLDSISVEFIGEGAPQDALLYYEYKDNEKSIGPNHLIEIVQQGNSLKLFDKGIEKTSFTILEDLAQ